MVATAVASYLLLTADYGPEPNALDPVSFVSPNLFSFHQVSVNRLSLVSV